MYQRTMNNRIKIKDKRGYDMSIILTEEGRFLVCYIDSKVSFPFDFPIYEYLPGDTCEVMQFVLKAVFNPSDIPVIESNLVGEPPLMVTDFHCDIQYLIL